MNPRLHQEFRHPTVADCRWIDLPRHTDGRGELTIAETAPTPGAPIPFAVRRAYWLHDVAPDARRGEHGHRDLEQVFVALSGRCLLQVWDGEAERTFQLESPSRGVYLPRMMWRELSDFAPGTAVLVLASLPYDESDYFRDRASFLRARGEP